MNGDFDIGTIVYVVITLVAVLIGLLGRKKKAAGAGSESARDTGENDFMQNLGKAFGTGRDVQASNAEMHRQEEPGMVRKASDMWEEYAQLHGTEEEKEHIAERGFRGGMEREEKEEEEEKEILSEIEEPADQLDVIELGEYEGTNYFDIVRDFDAGTAVVYSAIINRPAY